MLRTRVTPFGFNLSRMTIHRYAKDGQTILLLSGKHLLTIALFWLAALKCLAQSVILSLDVIMSIGGTPSG